MAPPWAALIEEGRPRCVKSEYPNLPKTGQGVVVDRMDEFVSSVGEVCFLDAREALRRSLRARGEIGGLDCSGEHTFDLERRAGLVCGG